MGFFASLKKKRRKKKKQQTESESVNTDVFSESNKGSNLF